MTTPTPSPTVVSAASRLRVAELDRRFYAFVIDRLVAWSVALAVGVLAYRVLVTDGSILARILVVAGAFVLVGLALAVALGLSGLTPGKALLGLRVVRPAGGTPIGLRSAVLRSLVLGAGALPTFGLGLAVLAWTAVTDPGRQRRGWHDHVAGSMVVDVRPAPAAAPEEEPRPGQIVNLTALRLAAAPPPPAAPELPGAPPARERPTARSVVWRVAFDTGESFPVEGLALVGRRPEPRPGESVAHLVALRSQDMSLSKTHAQLEVAPDGVLVVTDRGSTNGSVLLRQGVSRDLPAGKPTTLLAGDVVRFGDRQMTVAEDS